MASEIPHNMPILPSTRSGYSIRRVGDPVLTRRARILPAENPSGRGRGEEESAKTGKKKSLELPDTFAQLDPDAFAREALSMNGYRDWVLRGDTASRKDSAAKESASAVQEEFGFAEAPPGEELPKPVPASGKGLLGLVMSRYLPSLSGAGEGSGFLAYA